MSETAQQQAQKMFPCNCETFKDGSHWYSCQSQYQDDVIPLFERISMFEAERDVVLADARALAQWIQTEREEWRALEVLVSLHGHVKLSASVPKMGADMETILREHGAKYVEAK